MTYQTAIEAKPTTEQRLRYVDLVFDTIKEAERALISQGRISSEKPFGHQMPSPRGKAIAEYADTLLAQAAIDERLPASLLHTRAKACFYSILEAQVAS